MTTHRHGWRWSWRGAVALVLAVCLGVGFAVSIISDATRAAPISTEHAALLNTLGGALIGALAGWLGATALDERGDDDSDHTDSTGGREG